MNDEPRIPYTNSIVFAAEYISRASKEYVRKIIKDYNFLIGYEEYIILDTVFFYPGCIQMEIAKKVCMQRSYLCKLITKLEDIGLIAREKKIKGKRQVVLAVYITQEGEELYKEMHSVFKKELLNKQIVDAEKLKEITKELFKMGDDLVSNFNLKL